MTAPECPSCHATAGRPHTEYCRAPRCAHFAEHGEGVVWPLAVSLDHFDNCLTPEKRLQRWGFIREDGEQSRRCLEQDHAARLAWLEEETAPHDPDRYRGEPVSTADDVIDNIDHALHDFSASPDAMRWTPEPAKAGEPHQSGPTLTLLIQPDVTRFMAAIAEASRRWQEALRPAFEKVAEIANAFAAADKQLQQARRSEMRTAYRARSRRRTRRNR